MPVGFDLLFESFIEFVPEETRNVVLIVVIGIGVVNTIVDLYERIKKDRRARNFWIGYLAEIDENLAKAITTFNWFVYPSLKLQYALLVFSYLISGILVAASFHFGFSAMLLVVYILAVFVVVLVFYLNSKIKEIISSERFSDSLVEKLRKLTLYSLLSSHLSYGITLFVIVFLLSFVVYLFNSIEDKTAFSFIMTLKNYTIVLSILVFIILISGVVPFYWPRNTRGTVINYLRSKLNENYVRKTEITIFSNESEKISGRLIDIYDRKILKLENDRGEKFLVPWDSISFLAIKSEVSLDSEKK
ncbi:hypothetical protein [Archaeoglobus veneficus]|uniref:Uncharacterized protein n=1 Tax=Archaeoglobus veneficus (strain DSM 11195 / SNP6) TaxID=693661 RepID=F2KQJ4_ARCVS|nr:hypothetical protein [Archaeoglobus veneficus]AEA47727.1 hypothetical protein Arcve_1728 [Archaeoglobus veneficus SNP6]